MRRIFYNLILPIQNWILRRHYLKEWIAEGRDPKKFPRAGALTLADYEWAKGIVRARNLK